MDNQRFWPAGRPPSEGESIETSCVQCGLQWSVHVDLAGGSLACEGGEWVSVPAPIRPQSLPLHKAPSEQALIDGTAPAPLTTEDKVQEFFKPIEGFEPSQKESTKGMLQLALVMASFWLPSLLATEFMGDEFGASLMPIFGLMSGAIVVLIGALTGGVAFVALRKASLIEFGEAVLMALFMFGMVYLIYPHTGSDGGEDGTGLSELMEYLGPALGIFTVALCPALFEELAFRGLVQSRADRVLGKRQGLLVTATAFMCAHGLSLASPIHLALGLHLSWLRNRSGSLIPGMVEHFVYNALVVTYLY